MASDGDTVSVHYTGTLGDGSVFDSSRGGEPLEFTLGEGKVIAGFEEIVRGMQVGEVKTATIPSDEAYGERREEMVMVVGREQLPEGMEPEVGQQLTVQLSNGATATVLVTEVTETTITLDANHPMAGKDLTFEVELVEIK